MLFVEDFFEKQSETPANSHYKAPIYGAGPSGYKNIDSAGTSSAPAPAIGQRAPGPSGPPRQYGPDVIVHEKGRGYAGEDKRGVEYTPLSERVLKYKAVIAARITRGSAFETLDTPSAKLKAVGEYGASNIGNATLEEGPSQEALAREWAAKALIWVCVPVDAKDARQSVFYTHVCRPGAFHHSSLGAGREVLGGGEWIVEAGKLKKISANSGHYQPSLGSLHQCVLTLSPAWQPDTTVFLWNKSTRLWQDVPVAAFAKDATGGGVYASHPRAA